MEGMKGVDMNGGKFSISSILYKELAEIANFPPILNRTPFMHPPTIQGWKH
jgi:hypothetical protein